MTERRRTTSDRQAAFSRDRQMRDTRTEAEKERDAKLTTSERQARAAVRPRSAK